MIITNIESVPGKEIVEHYGVVSGSTVRAKHVGRVIAASFKNIFGGELKGYTELLSESREEGAKESRLVNGSVVISIDYFKEFVASLVNFFGEGEGFSL